MGDGGPAHGHGLSPSAGGAVGARARHNQETRRRRFYDPDRERGHCFYLASPHRPLDGQLRIRRLCLRLDRAGAGERTRSLRSAADRAAFHSGIYTGRLVRPAARVSVRQPLARLRVRHGGRADRRPDRLRARAAGRGPSGLAVLFRVRRAAVFLADRDVRRLGARLQLDRRRAAARLHRSSADLHRQRCGPLRDAHALECHHRDGRAGRHWMVCRAAADHTDRSQVEDCNAIRSQAL